MMEARFYAWFLEELLRALEEEAAAVPASADSVRAGQATETVLQDGRRIPRTSNATRRPQETALSVQHAERAWQLGDDPRSDLVTFAVEDDETFVPPRALPWMPPQPVMLPLAPVMSVNAPPFAMLPAHAFYPAADGMFDAGFNRESGVGFCPPLEEGSLPVEPTGVFVTFNAVACERDTKTRPEHLGTSERFNMRLPLMAGIENGRRYLRIVRAPMKTFEYRGGGN